MHVLVVRVVRRPRIWMERHRPAVTTGGGGMGGATVAVELLQVLIGGHHREHAGRRAVNRVSVPVRAAAAGGVIYTHGLRANPSQVLRAKNFHGALFNPPEG